MRWPLVALSLVLMVRAMQTVGQWRQHHLTALPTGRLTAEQEAKLVYIAREERRIQRVRVELANRLGRFPTPVEWAQAAANVGDVDRLRALRQASVRAKHTLVEANAGLVASIARQYSRAHAEDLIQEGTLGLIHAVDKFDPCRGVRLSTYATLWIRAAIVEWLRRSTGVISVPQRALDMNKKANREAEKLTVELGRSPTLGELEKRLGVTQSKLRRSRKVAKLASSCVSLEQPDLVGCDIADSLESVSSDSDPDRLRDALFLALETHLNDRELRVLRLRYGLDDGVLRSTRDTAELLGVSKESVRLTSLKAFRKLRGSDLGNALLDYME